MAQANLLWGAPRIHGELVKLGCLAPDAPRVAQATLADGARS
jgi:hypothetical protein